MEEVKVYYGSVIWFSVKKNFGFITWDIDGVKQTDLFIHWSDIQMNGFKVLFANQNVSFSIGKNVHGQPKAINVQVLRN